MTFCPPIGHRQERGDYQESWQPTAMTDAAIAEAQDMARKVVDDLGGYGLFGVEFFVKGEEVIFSELSPRPHDTGLVTLISQDMSEFALHARAVLGLPVPDITLYGSAASHVILGQGTSDTIGYDIDPDVLAEPHTQFRLFGKPDINGTRRLGVALARGDTCEKARDTAARLSKSVTVTLT